MNAAPMIEMPAPLMAAAEKLADREAEFAAAEAVVAEAEQAVAAGHQADVERVAQAREQGKADPKGQAEEQARLGLTAAEREREIAQARLSQVRAEYGQLAQEQQGKWEAALRRRWSKADQQLRRATETLAAAAADRAEVTASWLWLTAPERGQDPDLTLRKSRAAAADLDLSEVVQHIEQGSCEIVTEAMIRQHREQVEREQTERAERERRMEEARAAFAAERERAAKRRVTLSG